MYGFFCSWVPMEHPKLAVSISVFSGIRVLPDIDHHRLPMGRFRFSFVAEQKPFSFKAPGQSYAFREEPG